MTVDPRRPVDELRAMADRMRKLEDRIERLAAPSGTQVARLVFRLANAVATESLTSVSYNQNNLSTPANNFDAAALTFARPAGATRATVLSSGAFSLRGTFNSPASGTVRLRIGGVDGPASFTGSPIIGQVFSGGIPNGDEAAIGQSLQTLSHARTFDTSAASVEVSARIDVGLFGAGSSMLASIVATVFWSAP